MDSFGLQPDSYMLASRMLLAGHPDSIETLRTRFTTDFLPNMATSRSNATWQWTRTDRIPLPGLGSEYWKHARAHLFCGAMPPSFPSALVKPAKHFSEQQLHQYLQATWKLWDVRGIDSISTVSWPEAVVVSEAGIGPLLQIPIYSLSPDVYQNRRQIHTENVTTFHGTRESNIRNILCSGIHPSPRSHGAVGIWSNYSLREALCWTPTVVDLSPSLALAITGDKRAAHQNSDIASGNYNRMIFRSMDNQKLPPVYVSQIITGIPSCLRLDWYTGLTSAIKHSFRILALLPENQACTLDEHLLSTLAVRTHCLTSQRLAYGGQCLTDRSVGLHNGYEYHAVVQLSALLAELCWTLQLDSIVHRRDRLWLFMMADLPKPLLTFLVTFFPTLPQFLYPARRGPSLTWEFSKVTPVQKVGNTLIDNALNSAQGTLEGLAASQSLVRVTLQFSSFHVCISSLRLRYEWWHLQIRHEL